MPSVLGYGTCLHNTMVAWWQGFVRVTQKGIYPHRTSIVHTAHSVNKVAQWQGFAMFTEMGIGPHASGASAYGLQHTQVAQWQGFARFTEIDRPTCQWFQGIWLIAYTGGTVAGFWYVYRNRQTNMPVVLGHKVHNMKRWHSDKILLFLQRQGYQDAKCSYAYRI